MLPVGNARTGWLTAPVCPEIVWGLWEYVVKNRSSGGDLSTQGCDSLTPTREAIKARNRQGPCLEGGMGNHPGIVPAQAVIIVFSG